MIFFLGEIIQNHRILGNTIFIDKHHTNFTVSVLNNGHDTMQVSSILLWFYIDHRKELLLALPHHPFLRFLMQFLTHQILNMWKADFANKKYN